MKENWRKHANALKVKLYNGDNVYIEDQEHCALICVGDSDGFVAGQYYFNSSFSNEISIHVFDSKHPGLRLFGKVLEYSFDYGKTWCNEDLGTLEERYEKAAIIVGKPVEVLKKIDELGPECEAQKLVCDCILNNCRWLSACHFGVVKKEEATNV